MAPPNIQVSKTLKSARKNGITSYEALGNVPTYGQAYAYNHVFEHVQQQKITSK